MSEYAVERDDEEEKEGVLSTYSVAAGSRMSPITRYPPAENAAEKSPRLRATGTRSPEAVVYCSLDGEMVGIGGGVKGPCGGGAPTA